MSYKKNRLIKDLLFYVDNECNVNITQSIIFSRSLINKFHMSSYTYPIYIQDVVNYIS